MMGIFGRSAAIVAAATVLGTLLATAAAAHTCGDADDSGSVTVTDGVQVLRGAAGLSSTCTQHAERCDVDGSGTVTVSDGVNVLRKAAGIAITESCPEHDDDADDVAEVTDVLVPLLSLGLPEVANVSLASASAPAHDTEDCAEGGSRTTEHFGSTITVGFDACRLSASGIGSFQLDGFISVAPSFPNASVTFDFILTDRSKGRVVAFDGTLRAEPRLGGGFVLDGGPLSVWSADEGPEIFQLTFDDLTVDDDGRMLSGSVEAEDTSDSFELDTVEVEVEDGSTTAGVHVVRDDASVHDYLLDLETGDLTPVE